MQLTLYVVLAVVLASRRPESNTPSLVYSSFRVAARLLCSLSLALSLTLRQCARQRDFSSPRDLKLGSCHSDHGSRFSGRCPRPATRAVVSLRLSGRSLHFAVTSREQRTHDQNIASAALDASSRVNRGTRELHSSCSPLRLRLRLDSSGNSNPLRYAA